MDEAGAQPATPAFNHQLQMTESEFPLGPNGGAGSRSATARSMAPDNSAPSQPARPLSRDEAPTATSPSTSNSAVSEPALHLFESGTTRDVRQLPSADTGAELTPDPHPVGAAGSASRAAKHAQAPGPISQLEPPSASPVDKSSGAPVEGRDRCDEDQSAFLHADHSDSSAAMPQQQQQTSGRRSQVATSAATAVQLSPGDNAKSESSHVVNGKPSPAITSANSRSTKAAPRAVNGWAQPALNPGSSTADAVAPQDVHRAAPTASSPAASSAAATAPVPGSSAADLPSEGASHSSSASAKSQARPAKRGEAAAKLKSSKPMEDGPQLSKKLFDSVPPPASARPRVKGSSAAYMRGRGSIVGRTSSQQKRPSPSRMVGRRALPEQPEDCRRYGGLPAAHLLLHAGKAISRGFGSNEACHDNHISLLYVQNIAVHLWLAGSTNVHARMLHVEAALHTHPWWGPNPG